MYNIKEQRKMTEEELWERIKANQPSTLRAMKLKRKLQQEQSQKLQQALKASTSMASDQQTD